MHIKKYSFFFGGASKYQLSECIDEQIAILKSYIFNEKLRDVLTYLNDFQEKSNDTLCNVILSK